MSLFSPGSNFPSLAPVERGMRPSALASVMAALALSAGACSSPTTASTDASSTTTTTTTPTTSSTRPVYVVLFTHIEDNTPGGTLGSATARTQYLSLRSRLIDMGELARSYNMKWVLQPDWKFLLAAQIYEDASATSSTGGKNVLRYLRDSLGVTMDPHSHESGGYNYSDVAYLLDQLGVGGSTVIGGHIWDPALPQFAHWERFRSAVAGTAYPSFSWRGNILMGSGTPNHTNDPIVSGVWRPQDPSNYFTDSPSGNISAVGAWKSDINGIDELTAMYRSGAQPTTCMLTSSYHITPSSITAAGGLRAIDRDVLAPLSSRRSSGLVEITDFTSLVSTWQSTFSAKACAVRQ